MLESVMLLSVRLPGGGSVRLPGGGSAGDDVLSDALRSGYNQRK